MASVRCISFLLLLLATACTFDGAVPAGAVLLCTNDGDCPAGQECLGLLGRCVAEVGLDDSIPPSAIDVLVSADRLGAADTLTVSFAADEELLVEPVVRAGDAEPPVTFDGERWRVEVPPSELGGGFHPVTATLVDRHANAGVSVLAIVEVDVEPPMLIEGSVQWQTFPPPGVVPMMPTTLTLGSSARLTFSIDDFTAPWPTVVAYGPDDFAIPFTAEERLDASFSFRADVDEALPGGTYQVRALLADEIGNVVEVVVPLPPPGMVLSDIPAAPCTARDGAGQAVCTDLDADGHFGPSPACPGGTDCDDTRTVVHRGAVEIPGNLVDDDCDGTDAPLDASTAVFVAPSGRAGALGTPEDPFSSVTEAAVSAELAGIPVVVLQSGSYQLDGTTLFASLAGGFDETWRPTDVPSELVRDSGGAVLDIGGEAPRRLEHLRITGTACAGVGVAGEPVTEVWRVDISVRSNGCAPGNYTQGLAASFAVVVSSSSIYLDATEAAGGSAVESMVHVTLVDSVATIVNGSRVVLADADLHRSRLVSLDAQSRGTAGIICPNDCVIAGSVIETDSPAGNGTSVIADRAALVFHSTLRNTGNNVKRCVETTEATVVDTLCQAESGAASTVGAVNATMVAVGAVPPADACFFRELNATCHDVAAVNACAFPGCVTAYGNASVASLDEVVAGVPALDFGAPTSIAMDADGDCRGAVDVEIGADERP